MADKMGPFDLDVLGDPAIPPMEGAGGLVRSGLRLARASVSAPPLHHQSPRATNSKPETAHISKHSSSGEEGRGEGIYLVFSLPHSCSPEAAERSRNRKDARSHPAASTLVLALGRPRCFDGRARRPLLSFVRFRSWALRSNVISIDR